MTPFVFVLLLQFTADDPAVDAGDAPEANVVELTTLDGDSISGPLASWDDQKIVVGEATVDVNTVHQLVFGPGTVLADEAPVIALADGSKLRAAQVVRSGPTVTISRNDVTTQIQTDQVAAIRFAPLQDRFVETWNDLLSRDRRDDIFARVRGDALDHVGCILGEITEESLSLRAGTRDVTTARSNAFGVLFKSRELAKRRVKGKVVLRDGSELFATRLAWNSEQLQIETGTGLEQRIAVGEISTVDLAAGRVTMLRDLEPRNVQYAPFGDNYDEYAWQLRKDRNALDHRLKVSGKTFATGLWMHSGTTASFSLPARCVRMQATAGIDELDTPGVPVQLEIRADGRSIYKEIVDPATPQKIDLDLSNSRTLTFVASTTKPDGHGIREHLAIVGARLILE